MADQPQSLPTKGPKPNQTDTVADFDRRLKDEVEKVRVTVAPGRTIAVGTRVEETSVVKQHGPGAILEMPKEEAERLQKAGFLLPPDGVVHPPVVGPSVNNEPAGIVRPK